MQQEAARKKKAAAIARAKQNESGKELQTDVTGTDLNLETEDVRLKTNNDTEINIVSGEMNLQLDSPNSPNSPKETEEERVLSHQQDKMANPYKLHHKFSFHEATKAKDKK